MNTHTEKSLQDKRAFYSQPRVAEAYDRLRFGSASGAWVNRREIEWAESLLGPCDRVLDLACGTGRLTHALSGTGQIVGTDYSAAMLAEASENCPAEFVQADAFSLPFAGASFTTVVALRFVFHLPSPEPFLREAKRILAPGGTVVFDTYRWSPRAWLPLDRGRWGSQVYAHPSREIEQLARELGLTVRVCETGFLFSPYLYRLLPLPLVKQLDLAERRVPARFHARAFWKLALEQD